MCGPDGGVVRRSGMCSQYARNAFARRTRAAEVDLQPIARWEGDIDMARAKAVLDGEVVPTPETPPVAGEVSPT